MEIDGWVYDFESLPFWDNHNKISYVMDKLIENDNSDCACLIYSIAEVSMCNNIGFLAVLKNKKKPFLYKNVTNFYFPMQYADFSRDGRLLFVKTQIYDKERKRMNCPLLVMNVAEDCFSAIPINTPNPCYQVVEKSRDIFGIKADPYQAKHNIILQEMNQMEIKISELKWYSMSVLDDYSEWGGRKN